jgi:DNA-binding transcriptional regulator YdaS (Cro superfamily)
MERDEAFRKLLAPRGRLTAIANAVDLTPAAVWKWKKIPAERARTVSRALGIPLHEIRPDLWSEPAKANLEE